MDLLSDFDNADINNLNVFGGADLNTFDNADASDGDLNTIEFSEFDVTANEPEPMDAYAKIQERGNRRAESLSNDDAAEYNIDNMGGEDMERRARGIETDYKLKTDYKRQYEKNGDLDTDYRKQFGGQNENLNYLDDYNSAQYSARKLDQYEKEFYDIYNKAKEYSLRASNLQNSQYGGQEKQKRAVNSTLALMLELTKTMKDSGKYPDIKQKHFMKISKKIVDQAKSDTGSTVVNEEVRQAALRLARNPEPFVQKFRQEQESDGSSGSNGLASSNLRRSNMRGSNLRRGKSNMRNADDWSNHSDINHWTDSNDGAQWTDTNDMKKSRNNRNDKQNDTWRGYNSNYRSYAQSDLWRDEPNGRTGPMGSDG